MGGHGHGHGVPYTVPSPDIYKVEDVPELLRVKEKLAAKGLKDPWLRNEVWRYTAIPRTSFLGTLRGALRGAMIGIPAFFITIGVEHALGITYTPEHSDHH